MEAPFRYVTVKNNEALRKIECSGKVHRVGNVNGMGNAEALVKKQLDEKKCGFPLHIYAKKL